MDVSLRGRIVQYTITASDALQIAARRKYSELSHPHSALQGNGVTSGDIFPMMITKVWPGDTNMVNGQVFLDGNDVLWVTSVHEGQDQVGMWHRTAHS